MDQQDRDHFRTMQNPRVALLANLRRQPSGANSPSGLDPAYCLRKAQMFFGCYRKDEAHDPVIYSAAVASTFEGYPREVVERAADPRTGIAAQFKFLPAVAEVREFCDREAARQHRMAREPVRRSPPPPLVKKAPGASYAEMSEAHGRPIGPFERPGDKWNAGLR
jgi:hypothetical protein